MAWSPARRRGSGHISNGAEGNQRLRVERRRRRGRGGARERRQREGRYIRHRRRSRCPPFRATCTLAPEADGTGTMNSLISVAPAPGVPSHHPSSSLDTWPSRGRCSPDLLWVDEQSWGKTVKSQSFFAFVLSIRLRPFDVIRINHTHDSKKQLFVLFKLGSSRSCVYSCSVSPSLFSQSLQSSLPLLLYYKRSSPRADPARTPNC